MFTQEVEMMTWRVSHPSLKWKVMSNLMMKVCSTNSKYQVGFRTLL